MATNSTILLCSVPFNSSYKNICWFADESQRDLYILSKINNVYENMKYIDIPLSNGYATVKINENIEKMKKSNYAVVKNSNIVGYKFMFIIAYNYVNDNCTQLILKNDVWNNFQYNITFNPCYVERRTPSLAEMNQYNTLDDGNNTGVLQQVRFSEVNPNIGVYMVFCSSDITTDDATKINSFVCSSSLVLPCQVLVYPKGSDNLAKHLQYVANKGRGDRIINCVYIPFITSTDFVYSENNTGDEGYTFPIALGLKDEGCCRCTISANFADTVESAYFRKLCTFPYMTVSLDDLSNGSHNDYHLEEFADYHNIQFEIDIALGENPYYRIYPLNYKGKAKAIDESMLIYCDTQLPIITQAYSTYLNTHSAINQINKSQLKMNMQTAEINQGIDLTKNALSLNLTGTAKTGVNMYNTYKNYQYDVAKINAEQNAEKRIPNTVSEIKSGAFERLCNPRGTTIRIGLNMVKQEYINMIYSMWYKYGYPIRALEDIKIKPENGIYKYIKTIDCQVNCINNIGMTDDDIQSINAIFDNGTTIWTHPKFIGNYHLNQTVNNMVF